MTDAMTNSQPAPSDPLEVKSNRRFWAEFLTSCFAWHTLSALNVILAWRACVHQEQMGTASSHPGVRVLFFALWFTFFSVAAWTGWMSYRTWRKLSQASELMRAEGRERREYMSLCGLFISVTLGVGMAWLFLPLVMLQMCVRIR